MWTVRDHRSYYNRMSTKPRTSNIELYKKQIGAKLSKDLIALTNNRANTRTKINTTKE